MLEHGYADVNGVRLHYVTQGEGKLIMFVHGFPEFWYEWRRQLDEFGKDYQAVAIDVRGCNLSSKPPDPEQYRQELRDVTAACPHRNVHLIEGPDVLQDIGGLTADLIHPGDNGMIEMGRNLAQKLKGLLAQADRQGGSGA